MTFGQKSSKLNSGPVYCSRLYGMYISDLLLPGFETLDISLASEFLIWARHIKANRELLFDQVVIL